MKGLKNCLDNINDDYKNVENVQEKEMRLSYWPDGRPEGAITISGSDPRDDDDDDDDNYDDGDF